MLLTNPDGTTTYIPAPLPPRSTFRVQMLAKDVITRSEALRESARRRLEFLRAHPEYQIRCVCGHHQLAHEDGEGPCRAHRCRCPGFRPSEEPPWR